MYNYLVAIIHFLLIKTSDCHFAANKAGRLHHKFINGKNKSNFHTCLASQKHTIFASCCCLPHRACHTAKFHGVYITIAVCEICVF